MPDSLYSVKNGTLSISDSLALEGWRSSYNRYYSASIHPLLEKIIGTTFPDISFLDENFKSHNLSDFNNKELVVNYNYPYCAHCMDRIDSTLKAVRKGQVHVIVLLSEIYRKEIKDFKNYGENVSIGLISDDTRNLISFNLGDDIMYYLSKSRGVEFFDLIYNTNRHEAWEKFLEKHSQ